MMTMSAHSNLRRDCLLKLLCLVILLVGRCQAQDGISQLGGFLAIPIVLLFVAFSLVCICFWVHYCRQRPPPRRYNAVPATTQYIPYNPQTPYNGGSQPYPVQGYIAPSTAPNPLPSQPYPGQAYIPPSTAPSAPLAGTTTQTVPQAPEPVSLPEATLHQGDAPPGYEEAIRMQMGAITDQDEQQT